MCNTVGREHSCNIHINQFKDITKTCPCNIQRIFLNSKKGKFHWKKFDIFNIFAQNIDCGYMLEQPLRDGSNEYPQSMF